MCHPKGVEWRIERQRSIFDPLHPFLTTWIKFLHGGFAENIISLDRGKFNTEAEELHEVPEIGQWSMPTPFHPSVTMEPSLSSGSWDWAHVRRKSGDDATHCCQSTASVCGCCIGPIAGLTPNPVPLIWDICQGHWCLILTIIILWCHSGSNSVLPSLEAKQETCITFLWML